MNCQKFDKLIVAYTMDDEFDDKLGEEFKKHYLSCDKCWAKYERQLQVLTVIQQEPSERLFGDELKVDRVDELKEYAQALIDQRNIPEAIKCLEEARELRPGDEHIVKLISELNRKVDRRAIFDLEGIKGIAKGFISKYYPDELKIFDLAWRVFNDIDYQGLGRRNFTAALAAAGVSKEGEKLLAPYVVVSLVNALKIGVSSQEEIDKGRIEMSIEEIAKDIGMPDSLTNQLKEYAKVNL